MRLAWVPDPENYWFIESSYDNGYAWEILGVYFENQAEYDIELQAIQNHPRWDLNASRPPLRAGLMRFHR